MRNTIKGYRWLQEQPYVNPCPLCGGSWLAMNRCLLRLWSKYFINCEHCYFCGGSAHSLKGALRKWNGVKK